jgi:hypothetical protein
MSIEKKKGTSLRLEPNVLKELKILAVKKDTSLQAILESLIRDYLKKNNKVRG